MNPIPQLLACVILFAGALKLCASQFATLKNYMII